MSVSIRRLVRFLVGKTTSYLNNPSDLSQEKEESVDIHVGGSVSIAAGGSKSIDLGGMNTLRHAYIQTNCQIKFSFDSGTTKIPIGNNSTGSFCAYLDTSEGSLDLYNSTGATAVVDYSLGGE